MEPLPDRYAVRKFLEKLEAGARVIWGATGEKGTVQPDKSILWDDGSRMTTDQMTHSHSVLIHREPEWLRVHDALATMLECVKSGCDLDRWDEAGCKSKRPEELCPLPVLSESDELQADAKPRRSIGSTPIDAPRQRHRARA